jgi:hypothetical protein
MKAKYKISHATGETMFDGVEIDSAKMEKIKKWKKAKRDSIREWRKAKRDSVK